MPYNPLLGPDQCYGVDDAGFCSVCDQHLDERCECLRCHDCDENIQNADDNVDIEIENIITGGT